MLVGKKNFITDYLFLWLIVLAVVIQPDKLRAEIVSMPEPNPPWVVASKPITENKRVTKAIPDTEWTFHRTADNQHPNGNEQQMIWLMNRARSNPTAEGVWLAEMDDSNVASARSYFSVDINLLKSEFAAIDVKPPAAFDVRLYLAAKNHSEDLIVRDAQDHENQFDRIDDEGFTYLAARGNVFSKSINGVHAHAGFNIDWGGSDGTGMQNPRGHRLAIMAIGGDYTNVGIAMVTAAETTDIVGPVVTSANYCTAYTSVADHYNRFIVGTVWKDLNDNDFYDPGEGLSGITVLPDVVGYYAVTSVSGGYAIPIDAGSVAVTFTGSGIDGEVTRNVTIAAISVLLDLKYDSSVVVPDDPTPNPGDELTPDPDEETSSDSGGGCFISYE